MLTSIIRNGDNEGPIRIGMLVGVGRFELPASCSQNKCSNLAELHPGRQYHRSQRLPCQSTVLMRGSYDLAEVRHVLVHQIVPQATEYVQRRRRIGERRRAHLHRAGPGEQKLRRVLA